MKNLTSRTWWLGLGLAAFLGCNNATEDNTPGAEPADTPSDVPVVSENPSPGPDQVKAIETPNPDPASDPDYPRGDGATPPAIGPNGVVKDTSAPDTSIETPEAGAEETTTPETESSEASPQ